MTTLRRAPSGPTASVLQSPIGTATEGHTIYADSSGIPAWSLEHTAQILHIPNGWINRAETTVTVNGGTRTLTLTPVGIDPPYWANGEQALYSASQSVIWPNTEGLHFFYLDTNGVLQTTQNPVLWTAAILGTGGVTVWALYWSVAAGAIIRSLEERHGAGMDGATHYHLHNGLGTRRYSGGLLNGFTIGAGAADVDAQFAAGPVTIADEDMVFSFTDGSPQDLTPILLAPVFYLIGSEWRRKAADTYPIIQAGSIPGTVGTRLQYNPVPAGVGSIAEVPNNDFVLSHIVATTDIAEPIMAVAGQATYTNLANARQGANVEFRNLTGLLALLSTEFTPLGTVIYQTNGAYGNAVQGRVVLTDLGYDYVDLREGPK